LLLLRTSEPLSLSEFVAEGKVAEQRWNGHESVLDANARGQEQDSVADPGRAIDRDDGAYRTTTSGERRLERQDVVGAEHLADVRARLGLAVHTERDPANAEFGVWGEEAQARQAFDGDLLAEVAGLQAERLMCGAVDDHDSAFGAIGVGIALDTSTDAASDLADGARVLTVAFMKVQTHDAGCHAIQG
jgi:hypothetical protein